MPENGVKELFDKLNDVQFKYQFGDCFYTVFKISFRGYVRATTGEVLHVLQKGGKLSQHSNGIERMPSVDIETLEKTSKQTATFNFNEDKPWEGKSDTVPERQCNHQ